METNTPTFMICFFLVLFLVIFLIQYWIDYRKIKKNKLDNIMLMSYVIKKFKINKNKINYKKELKWTTAINSFIISSVGTIVSSIDTYIFVQLGLGFVLLFLLIYALYELYGRHLEKKIRRMEK